MDVVIAMSHDLKNFDWKKKMMMMIFAGVCAKPQCFIYNFMLWHILPSSKNWILHFTNFIFIKVLLNVQP